jgi:diguanylate cyclase (GGDEF)-like protein
MHELLLVEDSPTQALKLKLMLQDSGYHVTIAGNGEEGLALLEKRRFPVVITDWVMPKMDGETFCKEVRRRTYEDYTYILLLTGKRESEDIVRGLESGADDYLVKPPDRLELIARLKTAHRIISLERSLKERANEILRLTLTDALTGACNRRYLDEQLPRDLRRASRYGHPFSLIMTDIDLFKQVNDRHGHLVGDHALRRFVEVIGEGLREGCDWIARFGGEEFAIGLPETDTTGAHEVAERLREALSQTEMEGADGAFSVTASFGVATVAPEDISLESGMEDLLKVADGCLYEAKRTGRNRTVARCVGQAETTVALESL